jgi:hypothetical protein
VYLFADRIFVSSYLAAKYLLSQKLEDSYALLETAMVLADVLADANEMRPSRISASGASCDTY